MTPYTTKSGVRIGIAYISPPMPIRSLDAMRLQSALLDDRTARPQHLIRRLLAPVFRWL